MEQEEILIPVRRSGPHGVGGWLLWYCVLATFITPIFCLFTMWNNDLTDAGTLLTMGLCAFSMIAGINLWVVTGKAIQILRAYFVAFGLFQVILITFEIASHDAAGGLHHLSLNIRTFVVAVFWALYFHNSERVKNTYGMNL